MAGAASLIKQSLPGDNVETWTRNLVGQPTGHEGAKRALGMLSNSVSAATSSFFSRKSLNKKKQIASKVRSWRKRYRGAPSAV